VKRLLITIVLGVLMFAIPAWGDYILNWQDNSDNEDGFGIERQASDGTWGPPDVSEGLTVPTNITTYTDFSLGTENRCFRVFAFNASGESARSNEACSDPPIVMVPNVPSSLTVTRQ